MILFTGIGRSGSWQIRAEQLGTAVGAQVVAKASASHCAKSKLVVVVKRLLPEVIQPVLSSGARWVWDVVDAWPQPLGRSMEEKEAKQWLKNFLKQYKPYAVVWPTEQMMMDAEWEGKQIVLPHHHWDKYRPKPIAPKVERVGYEGGAQYLGKWRAVMDLECELRGWTFVINGDLSSCDIAIALRDNGGYPASHWKSNCKLANIQALGIPALCSPESGYQECSSGAEFWIRREADLSDALDSLEGIDERLYVRRRMLSVDYSLSTISSKYRTWLMEISR